VIAASGLVYGDLQSLIDRYEERVEDRGNWLCVTLSGDAVGVSSATSSLRGTDATALFVHRIGDERVLLATRLRSRTARSCSPLIDFGLGFALLRTALRALAAPPRAAPRTAPRSDVRLSRPQRERSAATLEVVETPYGTSNVSRRS
jgi:hypothetical protein